MINIRDFASTDVPALQKAIDADQFHSDWKVEHFQIPGTVVKVIEDSQGPVAYVLYTDSEGLLRISCVWADGNATHRNGRAIVQGIYDAVKMAQSGGYQAVITQTSHSKLANFLMKVMHMERNGDEYLLWVK